jgi:hypothetical protein
MAWRKRAGMRAYGMVRNWTTVAGCGLDEGVGERSSPVRGPRVGWV